MRNKFLRGSWANQYWLARIKTAIIQNTYWLYIYAEQCHSIIMFLLTFYLAFVKKMVRSEKTGETKVQVAARLTRGQSFGVCWLFLLSRVEIGYLLSRCLHFCPFFCWKDSIWKLNKLWSRYCTVSIDW